MTLDSYNRPTNGYQQASRVLRTGLPIAGVRGVQDGDGPAEDYRNRLVCIYYGGPPGAAHQARIHTSQPAMRCTHATRLYPINLHPTGRVSARLRPAHRHRQRLTANSPLAASYGARAGRTPLAELKSLPPDAFSNENPVAALVGASPYTHKTATPVNVVPARLQPTQQ